MKLYQFPISHYCEKVRWALDFKSIPYQKENLIPGLHVWKTKRLGSKTTVPILEDGSEVLQDSTLILNYLEQKFPLFALDPASENERKEALELEEYFDREVGPHLRRFFYYYLLEDKELVQSLLLQGASRSGHWFYSLFFPSVKKLMRKTMNIYEAPVQKSKKKLIDAIDFLGRKIENNFYLVGNNFSRADLSAAALLAPLCQPPEYDFKWPDIHRMPTPLKEFRKQFQYEPFYDWILKVYQLHRKRTLN